MPDGGWDFDIPLPPGDCVAFGADLEPDTLLAAYRCGLFPMPHDDPPPLAWWSPLERGVLLPDALRVTRSLRKSTRRFSVRIDTSFVKVVRACGDASRPHGWINEAIVEAYGRLHELGHAHSVEVFEADRLVGGLYGLSIGRLFAGESMFHLVPDASKVALVALVEHLETEGRPWLIDTQWRTDHLASLGVATMAREDYREAVRHLVELPGIVWQMGPVVR